eukprot:2265648-Prymnesium_polylepis.1
MATCFSVHVDGARRHDAPLQDDALLMRALRHAAPAVRAQAALGIGEAALKAAADACEEGGRWLE